MASATGCPAASSYRNHQMIVMPGSFHDMNLYGVSSLGDHIIEVHYAPGGLRSFIAIGHARADLEMVNEGHEWLVDIDGRAGEGEAFMEEIRGLSGDKPTRITERMDPLLLHEAVAAYEIALKSLGFGRIDAETDHATGAMLERSLGWRPMEGNGEKLARGLHCYTFDLHNELVLPPDLLQ